MMQFSVWMLVLGVLTAAVVGDPIMSLPKKIAMRALHRLTESPFLQPHPESRLPLAAASELSARLAAHSQQHQTVQDPRLPIPTPQDIEAIKKVAQILITLGQQVIPAIVGEPAPMANCDTAEDAVTDENP